MRRRSTVRQPWRKLLYIQQPYPDNHTDSSFLSQLKRNSTVQRHSFWKLAFDFSLISCHLAMLALIGLVFLCMLNGRCLVEAPLSISSLASVAVYIVLRLTTPDVNWDVYHIVKSSVLITLGILTLSPVLKSLSESTSSDSIWSLSFWLTCLNVTLNDYKFDNTHEEDHLGLTKRNKSFLGINLLIFNVVLLASRLRTNLEVFCFILFSFQIASVFPLLVDQIRTGAITSGGVKLSRSMIAYLATMFASHLLNCALIYVNFDNSFWFWFSGYSILNLGVAVGSPVYFLMLQKYKDEMQGPWDIAKPMI